LAATADEAAEWSEGDYMLARISDALELNNWLFIQANSGEDSEEIPMPTAIPRPGEVISEIEPPTHTHASTDEVVSFFNRMNNL
jgi:hypothetical protein